MFYAKPKLNNHYAAQEFATVVEAVNYLNEYNEMGSDKDLENKVSKLQAEDWWLLGKLVGPAGTEFRNNKVVESK